MFHPSTDIYKQWFLYQCYNTVPLFLKDTLNPDLCTQDCEMLFWVSPLYFAVFVLSTQFVLVNVVVAVLMKQLEDSKDSSVSSNGDCLSNMDDESFSNEHKISQSVDDEYEASINYGMESRDICLNIREDADQNSNTENEDVYRETHLECDVKIVSEEEDMQQCKGALQLQDAQNSFDKCSVHGEYGLDNAIIVVSPACEHEHENSYIPNASNDDEDYCEMKANSFLGLKRESDCAEISCCRSMPELSTSERTGPQRPLVKNRESQSCPQTMSCSREDTAKSKCKRSTLDRPFLNRTRSRGKVAPLARVLSIPSQDLSLFFDDVVPQSISSSIDS